MIRVVVADDQALVRGGFRVLVDSAPDLEVVGEAGDGTEAVALARKTQPDVVLMDIRMPHLDGLEATRLICRSGETANVKVLILTTFDLDEYVYAALRAGASGFLLKDTPPADLLTGIRIVAAGDALLAPSITRQLISEFVRRPDSDRPPPASLDVLTSREREVLALVARGWSNAEIAERLYLSPATAKTHVGRLLTKLQARDRTQLVVIAYETGLVTPAGPLRLDGAGGDVAGHVPGGGIGMVRRFDKMSQGEARGELAADLLGERMAVLDRPGPVDPLPLLDGEVEGGERERVAHDQLASLIHGRPVEEEDIRVQEPGHQDPARAQHAERFPPDRRQVGAEYVGHRVEHDIEAAVRKHPKVAHVAEYRAEFQSLPGGHLLVAAQLPRRVVEHGHGRARRGKHRPLLTSARGQAQDRRAGQVSREPVTRHRLVPDQDDRPVAGPGPGDDLGPDRAGPLVVALYLAVPCGPVMRHGIKAAVHNSTA